MATSIIIDKNIKERLHELAKYADKNQYTFDDLLDIKNGAKKPPGDEPQFCVEIPIDCKVVFTIEQQPKQTFRHLSVSIKDKTIHPIMVQTIMDELGFIRKLEQCAVFNNEPGVYEVMEPLN